MIHYAGGPAANICVITAASGDPCCGPDSSWPYYLGLFTRYGSQHVLNIPIDPSQKQNAYNQTVVNMLKSCTGWFFSGGDQTRVTDSFFTSGPNRAPTPALQAIRDTFNANGGVVAGSSAGTACQPAGVMITDGWSYYGLRDGTKALPFPNPTENEVTYDPQGGIAFFSFGLLDTHFGERGRQGRFIRLLLDTQAQAPFGRTVGYGMDQNTALVVSLSTRTASVAGTGGINIFNISSAKIDKSAPYFTVQNVLYSYATPGDIIDVTTGAVSFAAYKRPLAGREGPLPPFTSTDVFNSPDKPVQSDTKQFIVAATGLMNSTRSQSSSISWESKPTFGVTMIKDCMTVGYEGVATAGAGAGISFTSFINMRIDIQPTDTYV
jgi:cyanophycinase